MISRATKIAALTLAGLLAACDASITQPGLDENASVAFAKGGNSDAAKACQKGGHATVLGANGEAFRNAGQCVSYVASGGTLQPIGGGGGGNPVITSLTAVEGSNNCTVDPWVISFVAEFSGGTGTLNGTPITSGVVITIPMSVDNLYTLAVTNGTVTETLMQGGFVCT